MKRKRDLADLTIGNFEAMLFGLNEDERKILFMSSGLITGRPATYEEIGQIVHLTRERTRQIDQKCHRVIEANATKYATPYIFNV